MTEAHPNNGSAIRNALNTTCRYPFAHSPSECDCRQSRETIVLEACRRNAEGRAEQVIQDRWWLFVIGIVTTALSLGVLAVAANSGLSRAAHHFQISKKV